MWNDVLVIVRDAQISVPTTDLLAALIALSLCLLFRFNAMGLVLAFLFAFRLGWLFCRNELVTKGESYEPFVVGYVIFGVVVVALSALRLFVLGPRPEE